MPGTTVGMVERIVVEGHHGLGVETVRVALSMVGEGMMGPVLLLPGPLVASDDVGATVTARLAREGTSSCRFLNATMRANYCFYVTQRIIHPTHSYLGDNGPNLNYSLLQFFSFSLFLQLQRSIPITLHSKTSHSFVSDFKQKFPH